MNAPPERAYHNLVIGFTGFAESGKDTAADYLAETHGFTRDAFANDLRGAALTLDPWVIEHRSERHPGWPVRLSELIADLGWNRAKEENPEVRRILQVIGSEIGWQLHGKRCWVNRVADRYDLLAPGERLAISDVRFPHEEDWLREIDGILVRVDRPGHVNATGDNAGHVSEAWIKKLTPDVVLVNDGTIADLHAKLDQLMTDLPI